MRENGGTPTTKTMEDLARELRIQTIHETYGGLKRQIQTRAKAMPKARAREMPKARARAMPRARAQGLRLRRR